MRIKEVVFGLKYRGRLALLGICISVLCSAAFTQELNTFTAGQPASAADINANFDVLYQKLLVVQTQISSLNCQTLSTTSQSPATISCPINSILTGGGFESASGSAAVMLASKPVGNGWQCTPVNGSVDPISCFARCCGKTTSDSDDDGIVDADDYCVNTPANEVEEIDANGCGPSETTVSASYCANTPSDYVCNPSINFDDLLTNQSRDLVLLARQGISMPFTVPASTTTQGDFFYKSNNVILSGYLWKAWFSATPAGTALTSGGYCSISSRDPNGLSQDWSQVSANVFNCYLGQQRRVLYLNFGIFDESNALTYPANYFFSAQTILSNQ